MTDRLPLFPLGTVLFPGLVLPLHVFEERYRALVRDLQALPEDERRFGVVAIREGREVGADGIRALHEIGCTARVLRLETHPDGTSEVVSSGADRFRVVELHGPDDTDRPYLNADVEWLPDDAGDAAEASVLDRSVRVAFTDYCAAIGEAGAGQVQVPDLPGDPLVLSHLVAATVLIDLAERQSLLEEETGVSRLRRELRLLKRESVLLRQLRSAPSPEWTRTAISPN
jgi:Lon protease-like protein